MDTSICQKLVHTEIISGQLLVRVNLSYVTFQGNIEIGLYNKGGHLIQVLITCNMKCTVMTY